MKYVLKSHGVEVQRVATLEPILTASQHLLSPSVGIGLVLEDGRKVRWLCEASAPVAEAGDYFVTDGVTGTTYLVPAVKFGELFEAEGEAQNV